MKEEYQDAILNKSNKIFISVIKRYIIILILLIFIIIGFSFYKILNNIEYNSQSNRFFTDFKIISNRYSYLYYYFITLKSLFILNEKDKRWKQMLNTLENMNNIISQSNLEYNKNLNHPQNSYKEVSKILEFLKYNKEDSLKYIKEIICRDSDSCLNFLESNDNIFDSGIDFGLKTCFSFINNILKDYKQLKNRTDIN